MPNLLWGSRRSGNRIPLQGVQSSLSNLEKVFGTQKKKSLIVKRFQMFCLRQDYPRERCFCHTHENVFDPNEPRFKCDLCERDFKKHTSVIVHKEKVHKYAQCHCCLKECASFKLLDAHFEEVHTNVDSYGNLKCLIGNCNGTYAGFRRWKDHYYHQHIMKRSF